MILLLLILGVIIVVDVSSTIMTEKQFQDLAKNLLHEFKSINSAASIHVTAGAKTITKELPYDERIQKLKNNWKHLSPYCTDIVARFYRNLIDDITDEYVLTESLTVSDNDYFTQTSETKTLKIIDELEQPDHLVKACLSNQNHCKLIEYKERIKNMTHLYNALDRFIDCTLKTGTLPDYFKSESLKKKIDKFFASISLQGC